MATRKESVARSEDMHWLLGYLLSRNKEESEMKTGRKVTGKESAILAMNFEGLIQLSYRILYM